MPVGHVVALRVLCAREDALLTEVEPHLPAGEDYLPVVDIAHGLTGIVAGVRRLRESGEHLLPVRELMRPPMPVADHVPLEDALKLMVQRRWRCLGVVTEDGKVAGVLRDLDALRWLSASGLRKKVVPVA